MRTNSSLRAVALFTALLLLSACQSVKSRVDNAEVTTGPRIDSDGKFTDEPEVSVPLWNSKGIKGKPEEVTPVRR